MRLESQIGKEIDFGEVEVVRILYPKNKKDADSYIISCVTDDYGPITFTDCHYPVKEDTVYKMTGAVVKHEVYGVQVKTTHVEEVIPKETRGLRAFLKGKSIRGLGDVYADRLVDAFKMDTIRILDEEPDRLLEIKGIGPKRKDMIVESWNASRVIRNLMLFLCGCGLTEKFAMKLYKAYGKDCVDVVKNNPYKIINDVEGAGFKKADAFALGMGYDKFGEERITEGVKYVLMDEANKNGHCFLFLDKLCGFLEEFLDIKDKDLLLNVIFKMSKNKSLYLFRASDEKVIVSLKELYDAERSIAKNISRILKGKRKIKFNVKQEMKKIKKRAGEAGITYADTQLEAIKGALENKFFIVTGGPGTGKTTIIKEIITCYEEKKANVALAAPTGRASKRMQETTGRPAYTIHKTFHISSKEDIFTEELDADVLIVDETSMLNVLLTKRFLKLIKSDTTVIFVGDIDQLPPIGPGLVLRDMIDSGVVPFVRLSKIYRQGDESQITVNAHKINDGIVPSHNGWKVDPTQDFCFIPIRGQNIEEINNMTYRVVVNAVEKMETFYGYKKEDVQILCPIKKSQVGTKELNKIMQKLINPDGFEIYPESEDTAGMRVGDRVMQMSNNYNKGVYNGDTGLIESYEDEEEKIYFLCDGVTYSYDVIELDQLQLAYASTVHKSQGSQYPVVIMPLTYSSYNLLQRNMLYTAVTRAEKLFILIGDERAVSMAVRNNQVQVRNTLLKQFLVNEIEQKTVKD